MMKVLIASDSLTDNKRLIHGEQHLERVEITAGIQYETEVPEAVHNLEPDILILNITTLEKAGIRVLQNIRQNGSSPIVIMLTGDTHIQYRKACIEAGAHFFFNQSTELHKIQEVLTRFLQGNNILKDSCLFEFWENPQTMAG
ncbi:response regulator [Chloroflexota bacterium]